MSEVENYMLYDNDFLKLIRWDVVEGVTLANSLSEQRGTLVTSLVPHLLQNVHSSSADHDTLRFFEWARDWSMHKGQVKETRRLAGIFFHKKSVDFYQVKEHITGLFESLAMPVTFKKSDTLVPWAHKYQCASVEYAGTPLGHIAKVSQKIMSLLGGGDACVFEIDGDALLNSELPDKIFAALPKFQSTWLDISMMVPLSVTVEKLSSALQASDSRVFEVQLVDIFKKDEWNDQKSVTMRFGLRDNNKTLSKEDIDAAYSAAHKAVAQQGAVIR
jgi:phenylalanyl-tRNA synthetase beta subunit